MGVKRALKRRRCYGTVTFSLVEILLNRPDSPPPSVVAAAMMPTAMRAAMRPYSMAVAPDSSSMNLAKVVN